VIISLRGGGTKGASKTVASSDVCCLRSRPSVKATWGYMRISNCAHTRLSAARPEHNSCIKTVFVFENAAIDTISCACQISGNPSGGCARPVCPRGGLHTSIRMRGGVGAPIPIIVGKEGLEEEEIAVRLLGFVPRRSISYLSEA
jgi:hypothetical protein